MDVILPLNNNIKATALKDNSEAKLCICGLFKNFTDIDKLYIVTNSFLKDLPDYEGRIVYVSCPDPFMAKDANIIHKIKYTLENYEVSDDFLFISDDQVFIRPVSVDEIKPMIRTYITGSPIYKRRVNNTLHRFRDPIMINPHQPMIFNKKLFLQMCAFSNYADRFDSVVIYPLYFNFLREVKKLPVETVEETLPYKHYHTLVEPFSGEFPENCKILAYSSDMYLNESFRNELTKILSI